MNIVLYEPDIPWNTGNVGRTCVATGSTLHLVGKLGFSVEGTEIRRAGLDYWQKLNLKRHESWDAFLTTIPSDAPLHFFSKRATKDYWQVSFTPDDFLVFGCETRGLPESIQKTYSDRMLRIPMEPDSVRSLNLSTSVGVALFEALRQTRSAASTLR